MPELPEVETVRRGLEPVMLGHRIDRVDLRRPNLRFPFPAGFAERVAGQEVVAVGRRAKYLLADLSGGDVLIMHLGMTGRFRVERAGDRDEPGAFYYEAGPAAAHDHVVFGLSDGATIIYNDARRFGFMDLCARAELDRTAPFAAMGVEPLGPEGRLLRIRRLVAHAPSSM